MPNYHSNPAADSIDTGDDTRFSTIDWNDYWEHADEDDRKSATPSAHHVRILLDDLIEEKGVPDSFADVGCGPGVATFHVGNSYPDTAVVGYDAADAILDENRERARTEAIENISFEHAVLPEFDPGRQFDLVLCYGTLSYVRDSTTALQSLYDAVAPGGYLVLGYINERGAAFKRRLVENPDDHPDPEFDADAHAERFRLVIEGESTLSYREIHDALGTWPRSFWEFTEKPEQRWAWNHVPAVWIPQ